MYFYIILERIHFVHVNIFIYNYELNIFFFKYNFRNFVALLGILPNLCRYTFKILINPIISHLYVVLRLRHRIMFFNCVCFFLLQNLDVLLFQCDLWFYDVNNNRPSSRSSSGRMWKTIMSSGGVCVHGRQLVQRTADFSK